MEPFADERRDDSTHTCGVSRLRLCATWSLPDSGEIQDAQTQGRQQWRATLRTYRI
jgi:hypothetical protein